MTLTTLKEADDKRKRDKDIDEDSQIESNGQIIDPSQIEISVNKPDDPMYEQLAKKRSARIQDKDGLSVNDLYAKMVGKSDNDNKQKKGRRHRKNVKANKLAFQQSLKEMTSANQLKDVIREINRPHDHSSKSSISESLDASSRSIDGLKEKRKILSPNQNSDKTAPAQESTNSIEAFKQERSSGQETGEEANKGAILSTEQEAQQDKVPDQRPSVIVDEAPINSGRQSVPSMNLESEPMEDLKV